MHMCTVGSPAVLLMILSVNMAEHLCGDEGERKRHEDPSKLQWLDLNNLFQGLCRILLQVPASPRSDMDHDAFRNAPTRTDQLPTCANSNWCQSRDGKPRLMNCAGPARAGCAREVKVRAWPFQVC